MVQKSAAIGAPIIVAVSAPTALAVRMAEAAGMTLVAVARKDGFEVFTHPHRIDGRRQMPSALPGRGRRSAQQGFSLGVRSSGRLILKKGSTALPPTSNGRERHLLRLMRRDKSRPAPAARSESSRSEERKACPARMTKRLSGRFALAQARPA